MHLRNFRYVIIKEAFKSRKSAATTIDRLIKVRIIYFFLKPFLRVISFFIKGLSGVTYHNESIKF